MAEPDIAPRAGVERPLHLAAPRAGRVPLREPREQDAAARLLEHYRAVNPRTTGARLGAGPREHATGPLARADLAATGFDEPTPMRDGAR
ncbi:hypothetical protein ACIQF6_08430 [Kitasatospora sp. NPDC092948]|uniref:hypothetical protein n=1 Tax=Kitasatospora sp. NPDC092948 TaxID=3364088 RepID=UPI00380385E5